MSRDDLEVRWLITYVPHVSIFSYICMYQSYEVLKLVIMMFIDIICCFVKFGGQMSKNIESVRKLALRRLCVS